MPKAARHGFVVVLGWWLKRPRLIGSFLSVFRHSRTATVLVFRCTLCEGHSAWCPYSGKSRSPNCSACNSFRRTMASQRCWTWNAGFLGMRRGECVSEPAFMLVLPHLMTRNGNWSHWCVAILLTLANYIELFARSFGSIGEFIDIKQYEDGALAITPQMRNFSFPVRRVNGDFYAHVYPFDAKFFTKCTLREHYCSLAPTLTWLCCNTYAYICRSPNDLSMLSRKCRNTGSRKMAQPALMNITDGDRRKHLHGYGSTGCSRFLAPSKLK